MSPDRFPLQDQVVAVTGRMVSLSHADAADMISALGGRYTRNITSVTTMLVVGEDGLPLDRYGLPESKLRHVNDLRENGCEIEILTESEFLSLTNYSDAKESVRRQYTLAELTQIVGVRAHVIRSWLRHGLLTPAAVRGNVQLFDFGQVSRLRTLSELATSGISPARVRIGIEQLSVWLNDESPLELLAVVDSHRRRLVVRLKDGQLAETSGQLLFDFEQADDVHVLGLPTTPLLERAIDYEDDGELELAATVYREVLDRGDDEPETRFNFANVVYRLGRFQEAVELFEQALDRDYEYVEAWNNLGSAYLDLDRIDDAILAFSKAIEIRPTYADAHFNLATTLDETGRPDEARTYWMSYLTLSDKARRSTRVRSRRITPREQSDQHEEGDAHILRFEQRSK